MASRQMTIRAQSWPISGSFRIARGAKTKARTVMVSLAERAARGRGECVPYARYGESIKSVIAQLESVRAAIKSGAGRRDLQTLLPPGAARNALDCALWDLEAKQKTTPVWQLADLAPPQPVKTAFTISLDTPQKMALAAQSAKGFDLLKLKLAGDGHDITRLRAITGARADAALILDANEGFDADGFSTFLPALAGMNIALIEQPLPAGADAGLADLRSPIPLCADESLHSRAELSTIAPLYDVINIKLDKTGGLTEALMLAKDAKTRGLDIMIGCMVSTSLSMAPAFLLTGMATYVDLDGPLLLTRDRRHGLRHDGPQISPPDPRLWG